MTNPTDREQERGAVVVFPIPDAALDDRLGFVGTAGSGKTYNAMAAVERLIASGARVVIVDPLDVWWGLRLSADGKREGLKLPIFGGAHGDLPLNDRAGKLIGETVAGMSDSCIISLAAMPTKEAERRFMLDFLEVLYRKAAGSSFHVVFDEADLWAPQGAGSGSGPMLQALMEQIVRRGRVKGFIPWLITQRPAVVSKDVLSQVDGLVAFKMTSSQDRKAIGEWVRGQADGEQWSAIWADMPTMTAGRGVVWIPARGILETAQFPRKTTYDSSCSPKRGERRQSMDLKPLDLDALEGKLASIEDEVKASDPVALKAEISRLTKALNSALRQIKEPATLAPVVANADEIAASRAEGERVGISIGITRAQQALAALRVDGPTVKVTRQPAAKIEMEPSAPVVVASGVTGPGQRILNALAWWRALGFDGPLNEQVAFIAGYSPTSTGYTNPRGALKSSGLVQYPSPGCVGLTDAGAGKAEAPQAPPSGEELRRRVLGKLSGPQQRILSAAIDAHPDALTNEECADRAGYSASSTGYTNPRGSLKTLSLVSYPLPGQVRACDWLFPTDRPAP